MKPNQQRRVNARQMVVRDAKPEDIAKYCEPRGGKPVMAPVVDSLDKFARTATPSGGSRPASASIFAGGAGSRGASKRQAHRVASDMVWPDGPSQPSGSTASLNEGVFAAAPAQPVAGRRGGAPAPGLGSEFSALKLGEHDRGARRLQASPFPDSLDPAGAPFALGKNAPMPSSGSNFLSAGFAAQKPAAAPFLSMGLGAQAPPPAPTGFARDGAAYAAAMRSFQQQPAAGAGGRGRAPPGGGMSGGIFR